MPQTLWSWSLLTIGRSGFDREELALSGNKKIKRGLMKAARLIVSSRIRRVYAVL